MRIMTEVSINKQARLSDHFTLGEMCKTNVKTADGNIPSRVHIENLKRLCGWLEMLRDISDESKEDFDELLIERSPKGGYWLHFAVRPQGNRRRVKLFVISEPQGAVAVADVE